MRAQRRTWEAESTLSFSHSSAPGWPLVVYFHHVSPVIDHYTSLPPDSFRHGLELILESFSPVSFDELIRPDGSLAAPNIPTVLFTFDDGYADLLDDAVAELDKHRVRAVFFVCTDLVGHRSAQPRDNYLSWREVAQLAAGGHTIGSHGRTHRALDGLSRDEARHEVAGSLSVLRSRVSIRHPVYAYPYGIAGPVPDCIDGFGGRLTAFGTVKSAPAAWTAAPASIRRTYLPTGEQDAWPGLVKRWLRNWTEHQ